MTKAATGLGAGVRVRQCRAQCLTINQEAGGYRAVVEVDLEIALPDGTVVSVEGGRAKVPIYRVGKFVRLRGRGISAAKTAKKKKKTAAKRAGRSAVAAGK